MAFTFFFRDQPVLESAVDLFIEASMGRSRVRVWDAGCAMGPEPYTLLILIAERMGRFSYENLRVDATDIDEGGDFGTIIKNGVYPAEQLSRIPKDLFDKYFVPVSGNKEVFEVSPKIKSKVSFARHNLLSLKAPNEGYAMIVCKNVLLHFSEQQRIDVLKMFHASLAQGGIMVTEHTQKMPDSLKCLFEQAAPDAQIYRKIENAAAKVAA
jgi:chemotaxis protein methyltransferase CheR